MARGRSRASKIRSPKQSLGPRGQLNIHSVLPVSMQNITPSQPAKKTYLPLLNNLLAQRALPFHSQTAEWLTLMSHLSDSKSPLADTSVKSSGVSISPRVSRASRREISIPRAFDRTPLAARTIGIITIPKMQTPSRSPRSPADRVAWSEAFLVPRLRLGNASPRSSASPRASQLSPAHTPTLTLLPIGLDLNQDTLPRVVPRTRPESVKRVIDERTQDGECR